VDPAFQSFAAQALHYFRREHDGPSREPIRGPAGWRGAEMAQRPESWTREGRLAQLLATAPDPGRAWKAQRLAALDRRRVAHAALALAYLALLTWAVRRAETWEAAVLGSGAVLFLLGPAGYYTGFLAAWGLLWLRRPAVGVGLCALAAVGQAIALRFDQPDDAYAASSAAALVFIAVATALVGARGEAEQK